MNRCLLGRCPTVFLHFQRLWLAEVSMAFFFLIRMVTLSILAFESSAIYYRIRGMGSSSARTWPCGVSELHDTTPHPHPHPTTSLRTDNHDEGSPFTRFFFHFLCHASTFFFVGLGRDKSAVGAHL